MPVEIALQYLDLLGACLVVGVVYWFVAPAYYIATSKVGGTISAAVANCCPAPVAGVVHIVVIGLVLFSWVVSLPYWLLKEIDKQFFTSEHRVMKQSFRASFGRRPLPVSERNQQHITGVLRALAFDQANLERSCAPKPKWDTETRQLMQCVVEDTTAANRTKFERAARAACYFGFTVEANLAAYQPSF